jgi:tRNA dimethylallyltransferase
LLRALAFKRSSGTSILRYQSGKAKQRPFNIIPIALDLPRQELYARINQRVDNMMDAGLLEEVRSLLPYRRLKSLNTVGYSELFDYLDGKTSLEEAINRIKQHTRNYAKRQLTWFRKDPSWHWFRPDQPVEELAWLWEGKW